jgi:hypothetical protein
MVVVRRRRRPSSLENREELQQTSLFGELKLGLCRLKEELGVRRMHPVHVWSRRISVAPDC